MGNDVLRTNHESNILIEKDRQLTLKKDTLVGITESLIRLAALPEQSFNPLYEILRNAHIHGNKKDPNKFIYILINEDKISIMDQGDGFDYSKIMSLAEEAKKSHQTLYELTQKDNGGLGLGIRLIFSYPFKVEYKNGGSQVEFFKKR